MRPIMNSGTQRNDLFLRSDKNSIIKGKGGFDTFLINKSASDVVVRRADKGINLSFKQDGKVVQHQLRSIEQIQTSDRIIDTVQIKGNKQQILGSIIGTPPSSL